MPSRIFFISIFLAFCFDASSEFICDSKVTYKWMQGEEPKEVFHMALTKTGIDQEEATTALNKILLTEEKRALSECKEIHENLSNCLSARLLSTSNARRTGSFETRKALEEAIAKDCERQTGTCLESKSSAIECREIKEKVPAEEKGTGKDAKKKK